MALAMEDQIADAIASELNGGSRSWAALFTTESCTATATEKPWYDLTALATLKVSVVTATIDRTRKSRPRHNRDRRFDYTVFIDLQRVVDPTDSTTLRALKTAAEAMHDWFDDGHDLTGLDDWCCLSAVREDVYSLPQLYENRTFETLISVTVAGHR